MIQVYHESFDQHRESADLTDISFQTALCNVYLNQLERRMIMKGKYQALWMSLGMCIGLSIGIALSGNTATGMCIGLCAGMVIGMAAGRAKDKKIEEQVNEKGYIVSAIEPDDAKDMFDVTVTDRDGVSTTVIVSRGDIETEQIEKGTAVYLDDEGGIENIEPDEE